MYALKADNPADGEVQRFSVRRTCTEEKTVQRKLLLHTVWERKHCGTVGPRLTLRTGD